MAATAEKVSIGDGRSLLTHSRMLTAKTCHRKEWFKYELGLRRASTAKPLRMGRAVHLGIELWEKGQPEDEAIIKAAEDYGVIPDWCKTDEDQIEWLTEAEIVKRLLAGYFWRWGSYRLETVSAEQVYSLPIINPETGKPTPSFTFGGKWDAIIKLADGRLAVRETKTAGADISPESDYWGKLAMDQQISGYMIAARREGFDVRTVLYDVIRKPSIKPKALTKADRSMVANSGTYFGEKITIDESGVPERETPAMYGARLNQDISDRPDFYYARREIPRLDVDLEEFAQELWEQQLDTRNRQKTGRWYRNTSACLTMGRCEYFDLCASGWKPDAGTPSGFEIVECVHPELNGDDNDNSNL